MERARSDSVLDGPTSSAHGTRARTKLDRRRACRWR
jgi:hypothetical protein